MIFGAPPLDQNTSHLDMGRPGGTCTFSQLLKRCIHLRKKSRLFDDRFQHVINLDLDKKKSIFVFTCNYWDMIRFESASMSYLLHRRERISGPRGRSEDVTNLTITTSNVATQKTAENVILTRLEIKSTWSHLFLTTRLHQDKIAENLEPFECLLPISRKIRSRDLLLHRIA